MKIKYDYPLQRIKKCEFFFKIQQYSLQLNKKMKISILLPYKENYSPSYAGAVSIFINDVTKESIYNKDITIYGSTNFTKKLSKNYINIPLEKKFLISQSKDYVKKFIDIQKNFQVDILEVHNRPIYIKDLLVIKTNLVLWTLAE